VNVVFVELQKSRRQGDRESGVGVVESGKAVSDLLRDGPGQVTEGTRRARPEARDGSNAIRNQGGCWWLVDAPRTPRSGTELLTAAADEESSPRAGH